MLIDSHCHLNYPQLEPTSATLARAHAQGIRYVQTICTKMDEFETIHAIAMSYEEVCCSVGVHPNHVHEMESALSLDDLLEAAKRPKILGLGETGLDYYRGLEHANRQQQDFITHIKAARETGLAVIVHTRDAEEDTIKILQEEIKRGAFPFLIHCFSASEAFAEKVLELGGYISFSGILTFKTALTIQKVAANSPRSRILLETDAPYLAPTPYRGKSNEPAFMYHTALKLAELQGCSLDKIAQATSDNFFTLFSQAEKYWQSL
jgi:TatD DNase family protein